MTLDFQSKASLVFVLIFVSTDCSLLNYIHNHIRVCNLFVFVTFYGTERNENSFTSAWSHAKHDCDWYCSFVHFCSLWNHL